MKRKTEDVDEDDSIDDDAAAPNSKCSCLVPEALINLIARQNPASAVRGSEEECVATLRLVKQSRWNFSHVCFYHSRRLGGQRDLLCTFGNVRPMNKLIKIGLCYASISRSPPRSRPTYVDRPQWSCSIMLYDL